jgi:hypothetical protein
MNEQIEKLADQCQLYDGWFTQQGKIEKFAQLIVQECAGIITSQDVDPAFKNRMAWAIKEHFGVEE